MKSKKTILSLFLFFMAVGTFAQKGGIVGKITDSQNDEALIGATVLVKELNIGIATDLEGNYIIQNLSPGTYTLEVSYLGYHSMVKEAVEVQAGRETVVNIVLAPSDIALDELEVVRKVNRESETILLQEQRLSIVAQQGIGAQELSRKGIGDAQNAVAQMSGITKQEGVKNVFVRGLGDRYNATTFNGFPLSSDDPEYKNIALDFFGNDIIQSIGVNKSFRGTDLGDVSGAIIDIRSKELFDTHALKAEVSGGFNTAAREVKDNFWEIDGVDSWGFSKFQHPRELDPKLENKDWHDFSDKLDPHTTKNPFDRSFVISGGKRFLVGKDRNPLSFFVVGRHSHDFSFTNDSIKDFTSNGSIFLDQSGQRYSQNINQMILANLSYHIGDKYNLQYNFLMLHDNDQYLLKVEGPDSDIWEESDQFGILMRQQTNDNRLFVNQFILDAKLDDQLSLMVGASTSRLKGLEPDRRRNYFTGRVDDDGSKSYVITRGERNHRFFSTLKNRDESMKTVLTYQLDDAFNSDNSNIKLGYTYRFIDDDFNALEYAYPNAISLPRKPFEDIKLDSVYSKEIWEENEMGFRSVLVNTYRVTKSINSPFVEFSYRFSKNLAANLGGKMESVDLYIISKLNKNPDNIDTASPSSEVSRRENFFLPSLNLKYDLGDKHSIRFAASKTYTLPRAKELSDYQYIDVGFKSQGDPKVKSSQNLNVDLKYDFYMGPGEIISVTGFYKKIKDPIARIYQGSAGGFLSYANIAEDAQVKGVELEVRKNIFNLSNGLDNHTNRLSIGANVSYIETKLDLDVINTEIRETELEGATPFLLNGDLSYNFKRRNQDLLATLVYGHTSSRIYSYGTGSYKDIMEESISTLDFVFSYKFSKYFGIKFKALNLTDPVYKRTRAWESIDKETEEIKETGEVVMREYKKGKSFSLGITFDL